MNRVLYLDVYFAINFLMDFAVLMITSLITWEKVKFRRAVLAALFGGGVSVAQLFFSLPPFLDLVLGLILFVPMNGIAFGKKSFSRARSILLFSFLTSLFLGGVVEMLGYYTVGFSGETRITLGAFALVILLGFGGFSLWGNRMKKRLQSTVVSLSIAFQGRREEVFGLVDSGCFLREPESGDPVLILKADFAGNLFDAEELEQIRLQGCGSTPLISVPVQTATGSGAVPAFRPENVRFYGMGIGKRTKELKSALVALDFTGGGFAGCPCLVPLSVLT